MSVVTGLMNKGSVNYIMAVPDRNRIEPKYYSVAYFECITEFDAL